MALKNLDINFLNKLAENLNGKLDFLSFSKFRKELKNTECFIYSAFGSKKVKCMFFILRQIDFYIT